MTSSSSSSLSTRSPSPPHSPPLQFTRTVPRPHPPNRISSSDSSGSPSPLRFTRTVPRPHPPNRISSSDSSGSPSPLRFTRTVPRPHPPNRISSSDSSGSPSPLRFTRTVPRPHPPNRISSSDSPGSPSPPHSPPVSLPPSESDPPKLSNQISLFRKLNLAENEDRTSTLNSLKSSCNYPVNNPQYVETVGHLATDVEGFCGRVVSHPRNMSEKFQMRRGCLTYGLFQKEEMDNYDESSDEFEEVPNEFWMRGDDKSVSDSDDDDSGDDRDDADSGYDPDEDESRIDPEAEESG